ncbi:type II CAAX endopeptidase family protein [Aerococcus sp. UMB7834]|uniref:CPBP family intramembrane glutamic endopeptidase n=1 Tax=Aerococcus sp. UMB7834 TaxID=3046342 RepID=UPI00254EC062|nr:type II CAAX endopeptidase family protein [Aerococcus sp. UMB7834]MDK6805463.1 type II CAAX endopeptidase family protein [Aerococcus sp. UMB7834]
MKNKSLSRALVYSGVAFLLMILAQVLATLMTNLISDEGLASLVNPLLDLLIFAGIFKVYQIKVLKMGDRELGLAPRSVSISTALLALALPVILVLGTVLGLDGQVQSGEVSLYSLAYLVLADGLNGAVQEELVFRAIALKLLGRARSVYWGIFLPAGLFGLMHLLNKPLDGPSQVILVLAGFLASLLFSLVAYVEGNVWSSMAFHVALNGLSSVLYFVDPALEEGGISLAPAYYYYQGGPLFFTGGGYSILSSGWACCLYALLIIFYYKRGQARGKF